MLKSVGLHTYIRNNNLKSATLLLSYVGIALLVCIAVCIMAATTTTPGTIATKYLSAWRLFSLEWFHIMAISFLWAGLASLQFQRQINSATLAHALTRNENPQLFNLIENLSIACGITAPNISIIETPSMNAFITGLTLTRTNLTVTRGLISKLNEAQLTAVIAHEFTKIVARDVRHLSLATVFTSICLYMAAFILKPFYKPGLRMLVMVLAFPLYPYQMGVVMAIAVLTAVLGALVIKLLISKTRAFVADAGSCEITKDPESLVSALRIVAHDDDVKGMDMATRPLLFSDTRIGWFSSHPSIDDRVAVIKTYIPLKETPDSGITFNYPKPKLVNRNWRETFNLPFWVAGSYTMIPVLLMAAFFAYNTSWQPIDRLEVQKFQASIQKSLEYAMRLSGPSTRPYIEAKIVSLEWGYGIKVDRAALEKIADEASQKPNIENSGFVSDESEEEFQPRAEVQAIAFAMAKKDRSVLIKAISDAAYKCAFDLDPQGDGRLFGDHWSKVYSHVGEFKGFGEGHFPTNEEINALLISPNGGNIVSPANANSSSRFYTAFWDKGYSGGIGRHVCVFEEVYAALKDKVTVDSSTPQPHVFKTPAYRKLATGRFIINLSTPEGRQLEREMTMPTAEQKSSLDQLNMASWNNGTKPPLNFWMPAFILFALGHLIRSVSLAFKFAGMNFFKRQRA